MNKMHEITWTERLQLLVWSFAAAAAAVGFTAAAAVAVSGAL